MQRNNNEYRWKSSMPNQDFRFIAHLTRLYVSQLYRNYDGKLDWFF